MKFRPSYSMKYATFDSSWRVTPWKGRRPLILKEYINHIERIRAFDRKHSK